MWPSVITDGDTPRPVHERFWRCVDVKHTRPLSWDWGLLAQARYYLFKYAPTTLIRVVGFGPPGIVVCPQGHALVTV
jgi:hypothetical protein